MTFPKTAKPIYMVFILLIAFAAMALVFETSQSSTATLSNVGGTDYSCSAQLNTICEEPNYVGLRPSNYAFADENPWRDPAVAMSMLGIGAMALLAVLAMYKPTVAIFGGAGAAVLTLWSLIAVHSHDVASKLATVGIGTAIFVLLGAVAFHISKTGDKRVVLTIGALALITAIAIGEPLLVANTFATSTY